MRKRNGREMKGEIEKYMLEWWRQILWHIPFHQRLHHIGISK